MSSISTIVASVAGLAIAGGGALTYAVVTAEPGPDRAQVVKVIDGDTIDVRYDGSKHRIRLLNIDTPETKDPNKAVECLGPEATAFLKQQLEPGDRVRLEFDKELHDRYDRKLAGVFKDDVLVNAEIARHGLGVPVLFEPNRLFYDEVVTAYDESKKAGVGAFDPDVSCTFASRIDRYEELVEAAEAESSPEAVQQAADEAARDADALIAFIAGAAPGSLAAAGQSADELTVLQKRVVMLKKRATTASKKATDEIEAAKRAKAEAKAKKQAEREAKAEATRRAEAAEAQRQAEQAAADEAHRREQSAPPAPQPTPAPQPEPAPAPARPGAGYTGCRAYIGGPYIDDKGRSYTPIDCETKLPLVP